MRRIVIGGLSVVGVVVGSVLVVIREEDKIVYVDYEIWFEEIEVKKERVVLLIL